MDNFEQQGNKYDLDALNKHIELKKAELHATGAFSDEKDIIGRIQRKVIDHTLTSQEAIIKIDDILNGRGSYYH